MQYVSYYSNTWHSATGGQTFNSENHLDLDGYPLPITTADTIAANGVPTWNWSETPLNSKLFVLCVLDHDERRGIDNKCERLMLFCGSSQS